MHVVTPDSRATQRPPSLRDLPGARGLPLPTLPLQLHHAARQTCADSFLRLAPDRLLIPVLRSGGTSREARMGLWWAHRSLASSALSERRRTRLPCPVAGPSSKSTAPPAAAGSQPPPAGEARRRQGHYRTGQVQVYAGTAAPQARSQCLCWKLCTEGSAGRAGGCQLHAPTVPPGLQCQPLASSLRGCCWV